MNEEVLNVKLPAETIDRPRRRFFESAAMAIATAQFGAMASAAENGKPVSKVPAVKTG